MPQLWLAAFLLVVSVGQALCQVQVEADPSYYDFHPMSVMTLGVGFLPNNVSDPKIPCIVAQHVDLESGALGTQFFTNLVTNSEQLKYALSLDGKVDASYLAFKGGATFSFKTAFSSEEDSATLVIQARSEYGRKGLSPPQLTDDAQKLLSADPTAFAKKCGTRFVDIERRGASADAIITLFGLSREEKNSITTSASGSGGWGALSASGTVNFQAELQKATKTGRATIQVVATGGSGIGALGDTIKGLSAHPDSLAAIESALSIYLNQFTSQNSVPIGFHVAKMEDAFGWNPSNADLWTIQKERKLRAIVEAYRSTADAIETASAMSAGKDIRVPIMTSAEITAVVEAVPAWQRLLDQMAEAHKKCKQNQDLNACEDITAPPSLSLIPPIPSPPHASFRVLADAELLGEIESRSIVYDSGSGLLDRVHNLRPDATTASIVFLIEGSRLLTGNLMFRGQPRSTSLTGLAVKEQGARLEIATNDHLSGVMSDIFNFTTKTTPKGNGVFFIRLRDSLGRVFDLELYEANWNSSPPYSNMSGAYPYY